MIRKATQGVMAASRQIVEGEIPQTDRMPNELASAGGGKASGKAKPPGKLNSQRAASSREANGTPQPSNRNASKGKKASSNRLKPIAEASQVAMRK